MYVHFSDSTNSDVHPYRNSSFCTDRPSIPNAYNWTKISPNSSYEHRRERDILIEVNVLLYIYLYVHVYLGSRHIHKEIKFQETTVKHVKLILGAANLSTNTMILIMICNCNPI